MNTTVDRILAYAEFAQAVGEASARACDETKRALAATVVPKGAWQNERRTLLAARLSLLDDLTVQEAREHTAAYGVYLAESGLSVNGQQGEG